MDEKDKNVVVAKSVQKDTKALQSLRDDVRKRSRTWPGIAQRANLFGADPITVMRPINYRGYASIYAENVWVYASIFAIASAGSMIPWGLWNRKSEDEPWKEVSRPEVTSIFLKVNPLQSWFDLMEASLTYLEISGDEYWEIARDGMGAPKDLYPIRPDRIKVIPNTLGKGIERYEFRVGPEKEPVKFNQEDIVPFHYFSPLKDWTGQGSMLALTSTIMLEEYSSLWNERFFRNNGTPPGLLTTDQDVDEDQATIIEEKWKKKMTGRNQQSVPFLPKGVSYQAIGSPPKDMEFGSMQEFSREKIMAAMGTNNAVLGITQNMTFDNYRMQRISFHRQTMQPKLEGFAASINIHLLPQILPTVWKPGLWEFRYDFSDVLAEETGAKVNWVYKLFLMGAITPNEIIEMLHLGNIYDAGGKHFVGKNMLCVEEVYGEDGAIEDEVKDLRVTVAEELRERGIDVTA